MVGNATFHFSRMPKVKNGAEWIKSFPSDESFYHTMQPHSHLGTHVKMPPNVSLDLPYVINVDRPIDVCIGWLQLPNLNFHEPNAELTILTSKKQVSMSTVLVDSSTPSLGQARKPAQRFTGRPSQITCGSLRDSMISTGSTTTECFAWDFRYHSKILTRRQLMAAVYDVSDHFQVDKAVHGVDAILHIVVILVDAELQLIPKINILGTTYLLDAARKHAISRFVHTSSNHAVGGHERFSDELPPKEQFDKNTTAEDRPLRGCATARMRHYDDAPLRG
ncbi:hypothetical protein CSOJ01_15854 [Colletotrichum sojae]|uniref:3-beta hydroxysteroid dehydrogenase/isomerase domain-containing protein n=1 Tax=Colletotrichum sojae TaxID=2175907 RepID=A0A8H6MGY0_9PEZI|nr:hypothetical protein CSOJ01_15854 [Colletotrichum sojae]